MLCALPTPIVQNVGEGARRCLTLVHVLAQLLFLA
jgi:hypothetical protein